MVTYDFYINDYLGSALTETEFRRLASRAEHWLDSLSRRCCMVADGPDSRAMAVCAVAEAMGENPGGRSVQQESIGGVSVRYENPRSGLQRRLLQAALVYLDIYRGVD